MKLRDRLFNSFFFRNMLATFGNRTPYYVKTRVFPPYFQYKIGNYKSDYLLYFKKPPTLQAYNEKKVEENTRVEHITKDQILGDVRAVVGSQDAAAFDSERMINAFSELLVARLNQLVYAVKESVNTNGPGVI
jgi:hypothetical protein